MKQRTIRIILALGLLQFATACAIGTTPVGVHRSPFEGGNTPRDGDLLVRPFRDLRDEERQPYIGAKRNGYGMVLGHIGVPEGETLSGILSGHFVDALQHAGYRTALDGDSANELPADFDPVAFIEGDIVDFWLDMYVATWHNVDLAIRLRDLNEETLWEGRFKGNETNVLWIGIRSEFEKVIRQALDKALAAAVADFRHPDFAKQVRIASETQKAAADGSAIEPPADTLAPAPSESPQP